MTKKYDDIIHLSRPISQKHARMSMIDRGAQFSPFAALVGYDAVIRETARLTDANTELEESSKELLDRKLRLLADNPEQSASFLVFCPDERKEGGSFQTVSGCVKKIDLYRGAVLLTDGREIRIDAIREIDGFDLEMNDYGSHCDPEQTEDPFGAD